MLSMRACDCRGHRRFIADAGETKRDPTGTSKILRLWDNELKRRFLALERSITRAIVELDVLGLKNPGQKQQRQAEFELLQMMFGTELGKIVTGDADPPRSAFAFERNANKVSSFMRWLRQQEEEIILGGTTQQDGERVWQSVYLGRSYAKGVKDAVTKMRKEGRLIPAAFAVNAFQADAAGRPHHTNAAALIYTRAFDQLDGITRAMAQKISRILANGISRGHGAQTVARALNKQVRGLGLVRARTLARTELIAAYAEATLNMYEEAGIRGVEIEVEFTTAGDDAVCKTCDSYSGTTYTIEESRGIIPVHPNCRCAWTPVT